MAELVQVAMRWPVEVNEWLAAYARERGSTKTAVVLAALESLRAGANSTNRGGGGGGVPDLPSASEAGGLGAMLEAAPAVIHAVRDDVQPLRFDPVKVKRSLAPRKSERR
jgi:hypothetical protein